MIRFDIQVPEVGDLHKLFDAVDSFAAAMKAKLAEEWGKKKRGWDDGRLASNFVDYVKVRTVAIEINPSPNNEVNLANYLMFLWNVREEAKAKKHVEQDFGLQRVAESPRPHELFDHNFNKRSDGDHALDPLKPKTEVKKHLTKKRNTKKGRK